MLNLANLKDMMRLLVLTSVESILLHNIFVLLSILLKAKDSLKLKQEH